MFRKLLALSFVIVALHVVAVLTLGTSPAGSLIGNLLQIASSGLCEEKAASLRIVHAQTHKPFANGGLPFGGFQHSAIAGPNQQEKR